MHSVNANEQYAHFLPDTTVMDTEVAGQQGKTEYTDHARNIWRVTAFSKIYDRVPGDRKTCAIRLVHCCRIYYGTTMIGKHA